MEITIIKQLIKKIKFEVDIKMVKGHKEQIGTHNQNPLKKKYAIVMQTQERGEISMKTNKNNIKFYISYRVKRNAELQTRAIKEVVRIINARE